MSIPAFLQGPKTIYYIDTQARDSTTSVQVLQWTSWSIDISWKKKASGKNKDKLEQRQVTSCSFLHREYYAMHVKLVIVILALYTFSSTSPRLQQAAR